MAKCQTCGGTGRQVIANSWFPSDGYTRMECPICDGSGKSSYVGMPRACSAPACVTRARGQMQFVSGHRILTRVYEFPHLCPGDDCAISRWLLDKWKRGSVDDGVLVSMKLESAPAADAVGLSVE